METTWATGVPDSLGFTYLLSASLHDSWLVRATKELFSHLLACRRHWDSQMGHKITSHESPVHIQPSFSGEMS